MRRLQVILLLMCVVYIAVAIFSYNDLIFTTELSNSKTYSLIEHGLVKNPPARQAMLMIFCALLLELYRSGFVALKRVSATRRQFSIALILVTLITFFAVPFDSTDVSVYINHGWLQSHYGVNPYGKTVSEISNWTTDPMFKDHWVKLPTAYGPLFSAIVAGITFIGHGNYLLDVFLFKVMNVVCHFGITAMIYFGVRKLRGPEQALESAYLYGFSPFVLLHHISNVHNDILLAFFSCLPMFLLIMGRPLYVVLACLAGVAVKYISLILLPGLMVLVWRTAGLKVLAKSSIIGVVPLLVLSYIYFSGVDQQHFNLVVVNASQHYGSLRSLLQTIPRVNVENVFGITAMVLFICFCVYKFVFWIRYRRSETLFRTVLQDSLLLETIYICAVSAHFNAWYLIMFTPLALFLPPGSTLRRFCILAPCTLLFSFLWFGFPSPLMAPLFLWMAFVFSRVPSAALDQLDSTGESASKDSDQIDENSAEPQGCD